MHRALTLTPWEHTVRLPASADLYFICSRQYPILIGRYTPRSHEWHGRPKSVRWFQSFFGLQWQACWLRERRWDVLYSVGRWEFRHKSALSCDTPNSNNTKYRGRINRALNSGTRLSIKEICKHHSVGSFPKFQVMNVVSLPKTKELTSSLEISGLCSMIDRIWGETTENNNFSLYHNDNQMAMRNVRGYYAYRHAWNRRVPNTAPGRQRV